MKIVVNGQEAEVQAMDLASALVEMGYGGAKLATAVNEAFVPAAARGALGLHAGDRVEIVAPQQGG